MRAACPGHLTLIVLIIPNIFGQITSYGGPHYAIFSSLVLFNPLVTAA
jgi:hypothetical protein